MVPRSLTLNVDFSTLLFRQSAEMEKLKGLNNVTTAIPITAMLVPMLVKMLSAATVSVKELNNVTTAIKTILILVRQRVRPTQLRAPLSVVFKLLIHLAQHP